METSNSMRRAVKNLTLMAAGFIVLGIVLALWLQATSLVWYSYGDLTFIYWMLGSALLLAIALVAAW